MESKNAPIFGFGGGGWAKLTQTFNKPDGGEMNQPWPFNLSRIVKG